jgi:uncharacterized protein
VKKLAVALLVASALVGTHAHAQSFNCNFARTPAEVTICHVSDLSGADEMMASDYFTIRNSLPPLPRSLFERYQRMWLRARNSCGADVQCLRRAYNDRIVELEGPSVADR